MTEDILKRLLKSYVPFKKVPALAGAFLISLTK